MKIIKRNIKINYWKEFLHRVLSVRFLSSVVLMIALVCATVTGIDKLMIDKQEWITPWMAPHIFDNISFITFYGFIICYMYSDVPFKNHTELYKILREGRMLWGLEKIITIALQALSMTILTFLVSILVFIPRLTFESDWGKIIYTMAFSNNIYDYNIYGRSSPIIVNKYTPMQAMLICFILVWLVITLIGLIMFGFSLYINRFFAISSIIAISGLQMAIDSNPLLKLLSYVTPFYWCRMSIHGEQASFDWYYPTLQYCLIMSSVVIILLIIVILLRIKKIEFNWNNEE